MKTPYQAAAFARENVRMVQIAPRSYEVHRYDESRRAWIAGPSMDYSRASATLTEVRHAVALIWLGWDRMDAYGEVGMSDSRGRLKNRIRRSLDLR